MEDKYRATLKEIDGLEIYNQLLELQIENQARVKVDLEKSIIVASQINRQIVPVMTKMIESLDQFVELDVPFLLEERNNRVDFLKELMQREDVTVAEKFRKVFEAYQLEAKFGKTIETYPGYINIDGEDLAVDYFRLGRLGLFYRTPDGDETGFWNQITNQWNHEGSSLDNEIKAALDISNRQSPPNFILLPLKPVEKTLESK